MRSVLKDKITRSVNAVKALEKNGYVPQGYSHKTNSCWVLTPDDGLKSFVDYIDAAHQLIGDDFEWIITDPSCDQKYKVIAYGRTYLFKENRIINPVTKETECYESEMCIDDYDHEEIIDNCLAFGYSSDEISDWLSKGVNIPLILECMFELES